MRKLRGKEVEVVSVQTEFLNGQLPNTRQEVAAWVNLPSHSCICDLVLDSYKHAYRKIRELQRMPLRII
jgi:hypothetical protein